MERPDSTFVITDIHGCALEFKLLLNKLPLTEKSTIVLLGDYIDRGGQSREVIDTILEIGKFCKVIPLIGNHEQMLLDFFADQHSAKGGLFIYNGGGATLASYCEYGNNYVFPKEHINFFSSLKFLHQDDDYIFVHAGLPDIPVDQINVKKYKNTLLWVREEFFKSGYDWEKFIIHGHTPVNNVETTEKRINLDTGCCYNNRLTALQLPEMKYYSVKKQTVQRHVFLKDIGSNRKSHRFHGSIPVYLYKDDTILQFETVNFSEHGLLVADVVARDNTVFKEGDSISGDIGEALAHRTVSFEGVVVRTDISRDTVIYAIQFTKTPYDFEKQ